MHLSLEEALSVKIEEKIVFTAEDKPRGESSLNLYEKELGAVLKNKDGEKICFKPVVCIVKGMNQTEYGIIFAVVPEDKQNREPVFYHHSYFNFNSN